MFRPIHHTFAPLADRRQCLLAWKLLWQPWKWKYGSAPQELEQALTKRFGATAILFSSGRESLLAILQSLTLKREEEVIVQGYTCIVVPNAICAAEMVPAFVDVERDTLNLAIAEVERAITPKTRAIICQYTFGIPAFAKELRKICDRHSLILIEDCAHVLPDGEGPREIGKHGDVMFCSFGRDKAISSVAGGAVLCRNQAICAEIRRLQRAARPLSFFRIKHLLLYPLFYAFCRPLYTIGIGKALLALLGKLRLLVPIVTSAEKQGRMTVTFHRMPNACAILALDQLERMKAINDHRRMLTRYYFDECVRHNWLTLIPNAVTPDLPLQKFPLFVQNAEQIRQELKKRNIHLYDGWTGCVVCPANADESAVGYQNGCDPDAEMVGQQILSLPTHPGTTIKDAKRLMNLLATMIELR